MKAFKAYVSISEMRLLFLLLYFPFLLCNCSSEPTEKDFIVGTWRASKRGVHRIMTLRANGSWQAEVRIEGRFAKIIKKKQKADGRWEYKQGALILTPESSVADSDWQEGTPQVYEVLELDKETLTIKPPVGPKVEFKKSLSKAKEGQEETDEVVMNMGPVVVNLNKKRASSQGRYLCIELALVLNDPTANTSPDSLHPKIKESIIFYLSSLTYVEVNKLEKIDAIKSRLFSMLDPYLDGKLSQVNVNKFVVTAKKTAVDDFVAQYAEKEKGKTDN